MMMMAIQIQISESSELNSLLNHLYGVIYYLVFELCYCLSLSLSLSYELGKTRKDQVKQEGGRNEAQSIESGRKEGHFSLQE